MQKVKILKLVGKCAQKITKVHRMQKEEEVAQFLHLQKEDKEEHSVQKRLLPRLRGNDKIPPILQI